MNGVPVPRDPTRSRADANTGQGHSGDGDDPRKAERIRASRPDPILDRMRRHRSPADDELPLAEAIRHHHELQEHAGHG
jgi:hypothetical protein